MNQLYPSAVNAILAGTLDLLTAPLMVAPYTSAAYEPTHVTRSELYGLPVTTPVTLDGRNVANRYLYADPATFAELPDTAGLGVIIIYRSDTDALVAFLDQRPDLAPIYVQGNGGPVTVTWAGIDGRAVFSL